MLNRTFTVKSVGGKVPYDGATLLLVCDKDKGLALYECRGFRKMLACEYEPVGAGVHKVGHGDMNFLTGGYPGTWDVNVWDCGGVTSFRMRNKDDAIMLERWIAKYTERKGGE